jgi:hypothetical protein
MLRFTIRHVLWLTVVVALAVAWSMERRASSEQAREQMRMTATIETLRLGLDEETKRSAALRQALGTGRYAGVPIQPPEPNHSRPRSNGITLPETVRR